MSKKLIFSSFVGCGISVGLYNSYRTRTNRDSFFFNAKKSKKLDSNLKSGIISQNMSRIVVKPRENWEN
jgi:hypothetical protein